MSQYKELIENQKIKLKAEKWAKGIKCLEAKDGYLEREFNSGLIDREYQDGSYEVKRKAKSIEEIIDLFKRQTR